MRILDLDKVDLAKLSNDELMKLHRDASEDIEQLETIQMWIDDFIEFRESEEKGKS